MTDVGSFGTSTGRAARLLAAALVCAAAVPLYVLLLTARWATRCSRPGWCWPSLVDRYLARHLALIAAGLVVISTMSLRADLSDVGMAAVRGRAVGRGAAAVPGVAGSCSGRT